MTQPLLRYASIRIEMETRRAEAIGLSERYAQRFRAVIWGVTLACYAIGVLLVLSSYHIDGPRWASVVFWGGLATWSGGPFFAWVVGYTLGRERGIW